MRTLNYVAVEPFIPRPRLATYKTFFNPADNVELFGCYLWNKDIVSAFFPLIQLVEVSLRNAIHHNATSIIGKYWFDNLATKPTSSLNQAQAKNVSYHFNALSNARSQIKKELQLSASSVISADRIVAKMTFGFWTNLFRTPFELNRNPQALWPALIRHVFPNLPKRHRTRANVHTQVIAIQTFRNKAFHHEPVWNIGRPATIQDAINELKQQKETLLLVLKWLSSDALKLAELSSYVSQIDLVLSNNYLEHLKSPNQNEKAVTKLRRELTSILKKEPVIVDVTRKNKLIAKIYSSG